MSGTTQDTIVLTLAEDADAGDAQFAVTVNGEQIATGQPVTTSQASGVGQQFVYRGDYGSGTFNVTVTSLNGGNAPDGQGPNLYVDDVTVNGAEPTFGIATVGGNQTIAQTPVELVSAGDNASFSVACYLRGTRIAVPGGETAIEALQAGDLVLTARGQARPVVWIGHRQLRVAAAADPARVRPIRVKAGAVEPGIPARDLLVSPEHMLFLDGVLIPARALVDGVTVTVADEIEAPHYVHVELETHDVVLAEGMPAESWLDSGNRGMFANAPLLVLHAEPATTPAALACAPVVEAGPALDRVRERLALRVAAVGQAVEPDLVRIAMPGVYRVAPRANAPALRLVSPAARLGGDQRRLGATVTAITLDGETLSLRDARLARGFHEPEQHGAQTVRWTDGDALITFGAARPASVEIHVGSVAEGRAA